MALPPLAAQPPALGTAATIPKPAQIRNCKGNGNSEGAQGGGRDNRLWKSPVPLECAFTHALYTYLSAQLFIYLSPLNYPSLCLPIYLFFRILFFYPLSASFCCILSAPIKLREGFGTFSRDAACHGCCIPCMFPSAGAAHPCCQHPNSLCNCRGEEPVWDPSLTWEDSSFLLQHESSLSLESCS